MRHYYAMTDSFTGDDPQEYDHGFANTKEPLAFTSHADRDEWLETTKLLTARALTRREAIRYARHGISSSDAGREIRLYGSDPLAPATIKV